MFWSVVTQFFLGFFVPINRTNINMFVLLTLKLGSAAVDGSITPARE